jgi:hypothetical protein
VRSFQSRVPERNQLGAGHPENIMKCRLLP